MHHFHMLCSTDPISGRDVSDMNGMPYVVEGDHYHDLTIYFESEANRQAYLDIPMNLDDPALNAKLSNPLGEGIDMG